MRTIAQLVKKTKVLGQRLLTPGNTLRQRVVHAGFWAFALRIVDRFFGLARTVLLARLLAPEDFGLFGIALLALSMIEAFSETGFNAAIIQKKGDVRPYLDTAWTVQVIRGLFCGLILLIIAPYVAAFFGESGATSLLQALALVVILRGLVNTGVLYFRKELEFHKEFIYMFSGTLVDLGVAIPAALILRNAWALILGLVTGQFARTVVSYFVHPYRPHLRWEWASARELFSFGKWILGSSVLGFLAIYGGNVFVGKVLGAAALGLYQMAFQLSNTVATEVTGIVSQVAFPTFSKLQNEAGKLQQLFFATLETVSAIVLPITGGIIVFGPEFTSLFLGESWMPMIPALQLLALSGLVLSLVAVGGPLFWGVGRPSISFWMNVIRVAVMAVCIHPLATSFGLAGAAAAVFLGITATIPIFIKAILSIVRGTVLQLWNTLWPSVSATIISSMIVLSVRNLIAERGPSIFIGMAALWGMCYLIVSYGQWRILRVGALAVLKRIKEQQDGHPHKSD